MYIVCYLGAEDFGPISFALVFTDLKLNSLAVREVEIGKLLCR